VLPAGEEHHAATGAGRAAAAELPGEQQAGPGIDRPTAVDLFGAHALEVVLELRAWFATTMSIWPKRSTQASTRATDVAASDRSQSQRSRAPRQCRDVARRR
jgi:hypothetical protein